ncbi:MAG TPA: hypothetical protein VJB64_01085 [Patescibacteria group bacterium]|nr:hypothetical protein [Patescibacteria group bacterium]
MTITAAKQRVKPRRVSHTKIQQAEVDAWEAIRGMWKKRKIDAVKYQRKVRKEADHVHL